MGASTDMAQIVRMLLLAGWATAAVAGNGQQNPLRTSVQRASGESFHIDESLRSPTSAISPAGEATDSESSVPHLLVRPPPIIDNQGRMLDPRYAGHHHSPARIPNGTSQPVWRTPFAYGYFGARPKCHWSQHFGNMRQYHQWQLR